METTRPTRVSLLGPPDSGEVPADNDEAPSEVAEVLAHEEGPHSLGDGASVLGLDS